MVIMVYLRFKAACFIELNNASSVELGLLRSKSLLIQSNQ